jgi:hypothetical protein
VDRLLRLQHWQIFVYLIIVPGFFPDGDSKMYFQICWGLLFVLWVIKVDEELYNRLPAGVRLNFNLLLINFLISATYFFTIWLTVGGYHITDDNYQDYGWKVWIYIPMHLYCFFCFFYAIRFTSKAIASIENKRDVDIGYYGTYMAALFFFPIGIWWIQPKINRILRTEIEVHERD